MMANLLIAFMVFSGAAFVQEQDGAFKSVDNLYNRFQQNAQSTGNGLITGWALQLLWNIISISKK